MILYVAIKTRAKFPFCTTHIRCESPLGYRRISSRHLDASYGPKCSQINGSCLNLRACCTVVALPPSLTMKICVGALAGV